MSASGLDGARNKTLMKKKYFLVFLLLFVGVFFFNQKNVNAASYYEQPLTNGYVSSFVGSGTYFFSFQEATTTATGIGNNIIENFQGFAGDPYPIPTTTGTSTLNSITLLLQSDHAHPSFQIEIDIDCYDKNHTQIFPISKNSTNPYETDIALTNSSDWTHWRFTFDPTNTCDLRYPMTSWNLTDYPGLFVKASSLLLPDIPTGFSTIGLADYSWFFQINSTQANLEVFPEQNLGSGCLTTAFKLNFGFGSVDFGKGICEIVNFLIIPSQDTVKKSFDFKAILATHIPFSYYYQTQTDLATLDNSSSTMSTLSISIPIRNAQTNATTSFISDQDLFSQNTINKYTTVSARSIVKEVIRWSLYLAFISMVMFEVRRLFKHK